MELYTSKYFGSWIKNVQAGLFHRYLAIKTIDFYYWVIKGKVVLIRSQAKCLVFKYKMEFLTTFCFILIKQVEPLADNYWQYIGT